MHSDARSISLPLYPTGASARPATNAAVVDRSKPYPSCTWLEGGLAFNRRSLNACLIVHHNRGFPELCKYNGGPIDASVIGKRRLIICIEGEGVPTLMPLDVAADKRNGLGLDVIKVVVWNGVIADARAMNKLGIRHRLAALLYRYTQVRNK